MQSDALRRLFLLVLAAAAFLPSGSALSEEVDDPILVALEAEVERKLKQ